MFRKKLSSTLRLLPVMLLAGMPLVPSADGAVFAKYDGVDGESKDENHDKWIDVLSIDWGSHKPGGGATGQSRRGVVVGDFRMRLAYDKASPKIAEACLKGRVIPKLEIELTASFEGKQAVYLKYELKNVLITSYQVNASGNDESPPTVVIGNNFEEIKVTYTEFDDAGNSQGNVEYEFKVEAGE